MNRRHFLSLSGLVSGGCLIPASLARRIRETCIGSRQPLILAPEEVMTQPGKSCTPPFRKDRAKIEADYGRAALFLKLLKPNPGRYWEVFGPWSDVNLH